MMTRLLDRTIRRRSLAQIRYVTVVAPEEAGELVAAVYTQVDRDFGMLAPPIALHSPSPDVLAACWSILRETLLATTPHMAGRAQKEAVAAAVSRGNTCPYCVDVHSMALDGALRGQEANALTHSTIHRMTRWAEDTGTRLTAQRAAPTFPVEHFPEFAGVAVTFHYLNRMVNVFLGTSLIPQQAPLPVRVSVRQLLGRVMGSAVRGYRPPGASLDLLSDAVLPSDLSWAQPHPDIAHAFARAAEVIEGAGVRTVPEPVRALVLAELADWEGSPPGLGRGWADEPVARLSPEQRSCGRLALLTALASYQVDRGVIEDFQRDHPGDRALIDATAWASMAAARRIGTWIRPPLPGPGGRDLHLAAPHPDLTKQPPSERTDT